jgi:hypothetical protein
MHWANHRWHPVLIAAAIALTAGCNNDNFSNTGVVGWGGRFQLVVESGHTAVGATVTRKTRATRGGRRRRFSGWGGRCTVANR